MLEPHADFSRSLEVHCAERLCLGIQTDLELLIIRYQESSELYQHMTAIENEKKAFSDLIDIK